MRSNREVEMDALFPGCRRGVSAQVACLSGNKKAPAWKIPIQTLQKGNSKIQE